MSITENQKSINQNPDDFVAPKCNESIKLLYKDDDILVIEKPSGLLSLSGKNPLNIDSVHHRIKQEYPNALMCHRLDFGTSGVMLLALNKDAIKHINRQFELRSIKKEYEAILHGWLEQDEGSIKQPIAKSEFPLQKICEQSGKYSETNFQVLKRIDSEIFNAKVSHVLFTPKTGRTHQIRVHSNAIGHSILGDDLYADQKVQGMSSRLMLNALSIEFAHPTESKRLKFSAKSIC